MAGPALMLCERCGVPVALVRLRQMGNYIVQLVPDPKEGRYLVNGHRMRLHMNCKAKNRPAVT